LRLRPCRGDACYPCTHQHKRLPDRPVASGCGRAACSCGWRSPVVQDGDMYYSSYISTEEHFRRHLETINNKEED